MLDMLCICTSAYLVVTAIQSISGQQAKLAKTLPIQKGIIYEYFWGNEHNMKLGKVVQNTNIITIASKTKYLPGSNSLTASNIQSSETYMHPW